MRLRHKLRDLMKRPYRKRPKHIVSYTMSKIRSKDTGIELIMAYALRRSGIPFRKHYGIEGKPDFAIPSFRLAIFCDSDFWHGWQYPRWKHLLKNDFWRKKIQNNRKRDKNTSQYLRRHGWKVVRIWGHQIRDDIKKQIFRIKQELLK